jgi:hypothetical protein
LKYQRGHGIPFGVFKTVKRNKRNNRNYEIMTLNSVVRWAEGNSVIELHTQLPESELLDLADSVVPASPEQTAQLVDLAEHPNYHAADAEETVPQGNDAADTTVVEDLSTEGS